MRHLFAASGSLAVNRAFLYNELRAEFPRSYITGWFKFNDGIYYPAKVLAVFSSQTENLRTSFFEPLRRPDPTVKKKKLFRMIFRQLLLLEKLGTSTKYIRRKNQQKQPKPRRSGLGMDIYNTCKNSGLYVFKTAWTFGLSCGKHVEFASLPLIT